MRVLPIVLLGAAIAFLASPVLGGTGNFPVSTTMPTDPAGRTIPAIAYNNRHDEYLVVWQNTWPGGRQDVYGQRIGSNGELRGSWFSIAASSAWDYAEPDVAYDSISDQYLVVFKELVDLPPPTSDYWGISGRFVPWNGPQPGGFVTIYSTGGTDSGLHPSVANDPLRSRFLVVWDRTTPFDEPFETRGVYCRLVESNGTVGDEVEATRFSGSQQNDVVFNQLADDYLVVFSNNGENILGSQINGSTGDWVSRDFALHSSSSDERQNPTIATDNSDFYFVAWEFKGASSSNWDVKGAFFRSQSPPASLTGELTVAAAGGNEMRPATVGTRPGGGFSVIWEEPRPDSWQRIARMDYGVWLSGSDIWSLVFSGPPVVDESGILGLSPAAASSFKEMVAVFRRLPGAGVDHIYGWTNVLLRDGFETGTFVRWSLIVPP